MKKYYYRDQKCSWIYESIIKEIDFSHRWTLVTNTTITNTIRNQILQSEPHNDGSHLTVYQRSDDDTQIIIVDIIDNYFVVDHSRFNPITGVHIIGQKLGISSKPNIGFFSTIISLYLDALAKVYPIKISAIDEEMWRSYDRVVNYIAKKYPNYWVGKTVRSYDKDNQIHIWTKVIIPKSKSVLDYRNDIIETLRLMD